MYSYHAERGHNNLACNTVAIIERICRIGRPVLGRYRIKTKRRTFLLSYKTGTYVHSPALMES